MTNNFIHGNILVTKQECGKLQKNVENSRKMWETCGKHVGNYPKNVENFVDMQICKYVNMQICEYANMWICKYVNMQICEYVQNCRQLYKRKSIFSFFCALVCAWVRALVYMGVCAVVLFNCMLLHVGTERDRRTCNEWLCTGVMRMCLYI